MKFVSPFFCLNLCVVLLWCNEANAQENVIRCYFNEQTNNESKQMAEDKIRKGVQAILASKKKPSSHAIKIIPIVVHVIHDGGSENISDSQIQVQIDVLNEDYGKMPGTNGDGNGVDTRVRLCLAKISPNGNCTNGIVRIKSTLTNHQSYQRSMLTDLSFWDNTRYLNIYVVKSIGGGVGGYSSFPGGPPADDGIVVRHNRFGRTGTAASLLGRTGTHEVGHWLGLYHTFHNGCGVDTCSDGDFICDTPPVDSPNYTCTSINSCSNDSPDSNDQIENYMDYTPDACQDMFTNGQSVRMESTLNTIRTLIWSDSNLVSTGCDTAFISPPCTAVADFVTLTPEVCVGNNVYFMDKSLNYPTSWQWVFPGGTPDSSNSQNPTINYDSVGTYPVTLTVSDSTSSDFKLINSYISVINPGFGDSLSYLEDLEGGISPPVGITINNLDSGVTWELDSMASTSGKYSFKINNLINTNYGSADEIVLPWFNFSSASPDSTLYMSFNWAYARSDPSFSDEMFVLISTDCGKNFTQLYYKTGAALVTGPTQTTPFIPDSSQWKSALINFLVYKTEPYVQVKIVNVTDAGNNLYIDDIYIGDGTAPFVSVSELEYKDELISIFPNPTHEATVLQYSLEQAGTVEISIYNAHGQLINLFEEGNKSRGTYRKNFSTTGWARGMYFAKVRAGKTEKTIKFITTD